MTDKECTAQIKALADIRKLSIEDTDLVINNYYGNIQPNGHSEKPLLSDITAEEQKKFEEKAADFRQEIKA